MDNMATTNIDTSKVSDFEKTVQEYLKNNKVPHVYILTPVYGGVVYINYMQCMINSMKFLDRFGIKLYLEFCKNDSLVSRARNNLVAKAMSNPLTTHIMFIDADITWEPTDIIKLIMADKSLVGGVYPLKHYYWENIIPTDGSNAVGKLIEKKNNSQIKSFVSDQQMVQYNMVRYNVNFINSVLKIENNLTKVKHIATGFMMFKRSTIEQMQLAYPSTKYTDDVGFLQKPEENKHAYALFDCGVEDDHYLSEDWMFCHRWTKMGGSVYLDVSINLTHTGLEDYAGSFISAFI
jgi:glycosyltransferase involved in cell wall biosynthesis